MKHYLASLLIGIMLLTMVSCGSKSAPEELSDSFIKRDIKDYIEDEYDDAELEDFEKESSEVNGNEMIAICSAVFTVDGEEKQGEFTLMYEVEDGSWVLSDCSFEESDEDEDEDKDKDEDIDDEPASDENEDESEYADEDEESQESPYKPEVVVPDFDEEETDYEEDEEPVSDEEAAEVHEPEYEDDDDEPVSAVEVEEVPEEEPEVVVPEQEEKNEAVSDDLFDYMFELDGVVYRLPCSYSIFKDNGWVMSSRGVTEETELSANSYQYFDMIKDGSEITVYAINLSGNVKKVADCKIGGIEIYNNDLTDIGLFTIAKGINLDSTLEEITSAFGDANSINSYEDHTYSTYSQDTYKQVKFATYIPESKKWNSISIRNYQSDETDVTETSDAVPAYLSEYVAPAELGTDPFSGNVEVEGDVYKLPAPVSAFLDNGWRITQQSGGIGAGNTDSIRMERDGKKLYVYVTNLGSYKTTPANCAVYRIAPGDYDKISVILPGGMTFAATKAEVESYITDDFSYYEGSSSYRYSYDNYDAGFSMSISVAKDTEAVSQLSLSCKKWAY